jgi:signal transduction histidine kinase
MYSNDKIKVIASLLSVFILVVGIIAISSSNIANDILKGRIENQFLSESTGRGESIRSLLEIYSNQINHLAYRLSNDNEIRDILLANESERRRLSYDEYNGLPILEQKVSEYGVTFDNSTYIRNIKIMDRNGDVLLSSNPSETGQRVPYLNNIKTYSNTTNYGVTNIELNKVKDENRQLVIFTMPFYKGQQHALDKKGNSNNDFFISTNLDTNSFNKILLNRKGLGESGEVYLVNSSRMMVSESRFFNNTNPITVDTLPVRQCLESVNGNDAGNVYNDYRNIPIIGFSFCAKNLGFVLLAEIDKSEVLQPIDNLRNTMVIMSVISGFILIAISIVVIHTLLSWNKKLESANKQLQRQDIMQREFINVAAHELRTPIQPILALTEHLREKIKNKDQAQLLDVVIRNAQRLKKLSNDILEVTKIESNTLNVYKEWFSLDRLISETVKDFENSLKDKDIGFECHNPSSSCNLFADQSRIRQVISNLIGNSVKFIGKEGTVSITVEKKKSKDSIGNKKEVVVVSIKDNGIGIDKEILPNLFTKFASKSFQGTGLGLYISRKIVEAHGGKIEAENNNNGKGATFSFTLPLENTD